MLDPPMSEAKYADRVPGKAGRADKAWKIGQSEAGIRSQFHTVVAPSD